MPLRLNCFWGATKANPHTHSLDGEGPSCVSFQGFPGDSKPELSGTRCETTAAPEYTVHTTFRDPVDTVRCGHGGDSPPPLRLLRDQQADDATASVHGKQDFPSLSLPKPASPASTTGERAMFTHVCVRCFVLLFLQGFQNEAQIPGSCPCATAFLCRLPLCF